jgi:hypothetical protein
LIRYLIDLTARLSGGHAALGHQVVGGGLQTSGPLVGGLAYTADEFIASGTRSLTQLAAADSDKLSRLLTRLRREQDGHHGGYQSPERRTKHEEG